MRVIKPTGVIVNFKAALATAVACVFASMAPVRAAGLTYKWYPVASSGDVKPTGSSIDCDACHRDMAGSGSQASAGASVFNS